MTAQQAIDLAFDVAIQAMAVLMDAGMTEHQARETLRMALDVSEEIGGGT